MPRMPTGANTPRILLRADAAELEAIACLIPVARSSTTPIHIVTWPAQRRMPMLADRAAARFADHRGDRPQYLWFAAEELPDGATELQMRAAHPDAANREAL